MSHKSRIGRWNDLDSRWTSFIHSFMFRLCPNLEFWVKSGEAPEQRAWLELSSSSCDTAAHLQLVSPSVSMCRRRQTRAPSTGPDRGSTLRSSLSSLLFCYCVFLCWSNTLMETYRARLYFSTFWCLLLKDVGGTGSGSLSFESIKITIKSVGNNTPVKIRVLITGTVLQQLHTFKGSLVLLLLLLLLLCLFFFFLPCSGWQVHCVRGWGACELQGTETVKQLKDKTLKIKSA